MKRSVVRRESKETNDTRKCGDVLKWCWELRKRRHRIWRIAEKDTVQKERGEKSKRVFFNIKEWDTFNITQSVLSDYLIENAPGARYIVPRTLSTDFCISATYHILSSLHVTLLWTSKLIILRSQTQIGNYAYIFLIRKEKSATRHAILSL